MNKKTFALHGLALALLASAVPALADDTTYLALRLQGAEHKLADAKLTSPRVDQRIKSPDSDRDLNGAIALGQHFDGGWRVEVEYTMRKHSLFDSYWSPFDANVNRMKVDSQRLMLNGYKDFALTDALSWYLSAGAGLAHVQSEGYQGNPSRQFARNGQNNLAWSLGLGLDYALSDRITLGGGYRYVDMGRIETGRNTFANRINARDEQLKGKLSEQSLFVEMRIGL
ncbi:outer membrane protein [Pseudomonas sp. microsymbiont 2]